MIKKMMKAKAIAEGTAPAKDAGSRMELEVIPTDSFGFTVTAEEEKEGWEKFGKRVVTFTIYKILFHKGEKGDGEPVYFVKDSLMHTSVLSNAAPLFLGRIRSDGQSTWRVVSRFGFFSALDGRELIDIGRVMEACWLWAREWQGADWPLDHPLKPKDMIPPPS